MGITNIRKFDTLATAFCLGSLLFWSMASIFIKYLAGFIDSWTQNVLRYSAACLFWLPFLLFSVKTKRLDHKVWRRAIVPAAANIIMQSLWASIMYYIDPAFASLLIQSSVIWISVFSLILFAEERMLVGSGRFWAGMGLSVIGVVGVLCFKEDFAAHKTIIGVSIALTNAFMGAVYAVSAKIAFKNIDSRSGFSVISIYTLAGLFILAVMFGNLQECTSMGIKPWVAVVVSGVLCIALSHVFFYSAIKRLGATIHSLVMLLSPFIVLAVSNIVFGESLNGFQWLFGTILLIGAALAIWSQQHLSPGSNNKIDPIEKA